MDQTWKVGELASRTGVSVRTLHYYDEIGLLQPSKRTRSEHRLYTPSDVKQLLRIKALQGLGFSLEQIKSVIGCDEPLSPDELRHHIERLRERIEMESRLCTRLEMIERRLRERAQVSAEDLFETIKEIEMLENVQQYYDAEQTEYLRKRAESIGEDRIRGAEQEWAQLIKDVRAQMDAGASPTSDEVLTLARRWKNLIEEFTGGNAGITKSLGSMWSNEPSLREATGIDSEMFTYIGQAMKSLDS